jgi:hypothetical protein
LVFVFAASPQAIPNALIANTAERAKVFFILFKFSCLLQRLFYYLKRPSFLNGLVPHKLFTGTLGQYKFLNYDSQIKNQ